LLAIKATDGSAAEIVEIAEQLQVRHHSAVGLLNRTAAAGLVFRGRVESDRRHVCIRLTPAGETVLARLPEGHQHELRKDAPRLIRALERAISRRGEPERRE
jgi:DNA-binding MarR family transcriptional regulator